MKITKRQLRRLIKEELSHQINEVEGDTRVRLNVLSQLGLLPQPLGGIASAMYGLSANVRATVNAKFKEGHEALASYAEQQKADWTSELQR